MTTLTTIQQRDRQMRRARMNHNSPACKCQSDPFTWIVDDLGDMVICFACRTCHSTWTRLAPEPMQRRFAERQNRKAGKELLRLGFPPA